MLKPFSVMCVKAVLAMAVSEVAAKRGLVPVQIVSIIPVALAGKLSPDVPSHVALPRCAFIYSRQFCESLLFINNLVLLCSFS